MVSIGIFSSEYKNPINQYLQKLFLRSRKKYMSLFHSIDQNTMHTLLSSDIDYLIIDLEYVPFDFVDILIIDSANALSSARFISRHICPSTHLIYNVDCGFPQIIHPYAISCGLSQRATATVSSVSENDFIFCLQKPVITLFDNYIGESEMLVHPPVAVSSVSSILPAVTCGVICEIIKSDILVI